MVYVQVAFPVLLAILAMLVPSNRYRPWLLPVAGVAHAVSTAIVLLQPRWCYQNEWLVLDPVGKIVLINVSLLYLLCSFYAVGYLHHRKERQNRVFTSCLLAFIGLLSLVVWSRHLGLMWVAIEGTTLMTAPLIYFNHSPRSIEATWKYLMVGSVGIALALLGTFFLAYSSLQGGLPATLDFRVFLANGPMLSKPWLRAAFILLLIGYGTKMGLAPMHTWKPDAYGEAPGVVGALLAGGMTSGAFLALTRIWQICGVAGETAFSSRILLGMGLFSMATAGIFMLSQRDFKRMLAYSSIEHMGILAIGLGIGMPALFGTLFHVVTNTMTKGLLFLSAGNIHRAYASKSTDQVMGALRRLPLSGALFLIGFLAITGSPPFGPFASLFSILNSAFEAGRPGVGAAFLVFMLLVFTGMGITVLKVVQGEAPDETARSDYRDGFLTSAPALLFLVIILVLGIMVPAPLKALLDEAVSFMKNPV
jgi:hydrogenase-4 component F